MRNHIEQMKKYMYILAVLCLTACKPTPAKIAKQFLLDSAIHPSSIRILYHSEVLCPEKTKFDTSYYIAAIGTDTIFTDSIRIDTRHFPEHYYCCYRVSCIDDCGQQNQCLAEIDVFPDGTTMFHNKYRKLYCDPVDSIIRAQRDTLTDIRTPAFYNESGIWAIKPLLVNTNAKEYFNIKL